MSKISERQMNINSQFNDDLATVKTTQLFTSQALGAMIELLDGLVDRMVGKRLLSEDEKLVLEYRRSIAQLRKVGIDLEPPTDPDAPVFKVKCPGCQAVLKAKKGQRISRCDWCGHVFQESG